MSNEIERQIEQIVEEITDSPDKYPIEAKYLLVLETWHRQGDSYLDVSRFEILKGEVKEILIKEIDEGYPHRLIRQVLIIPFEIPTIIYQEQYSDFTQRQDIVHVFTNKGWVKVTVSP
jgi:hypothetical protein